VLQGKSPQVEEGNPKQLPGAKAGSFMNTVTQELFDGKKGIVVVPIHSIHQYLEWIPRDDGGGLVNVYDWQAPEVLAVLKKAAKRFGKHKINDNNDLQESFNVFMLHLRDDGTRQPIVMGFASSQIGAYQAWMTYGEVAGQARRPGRAAAPPCALVAPVPHHHGLQSEQEGHVAQDVRHLRRSLRRSGPPGRG
jgi:hypothetical protein